MFYDFNILTLKSLVWKMDKSNLNIKGIWKVAKINDEGMVEKASKTVLIWPLFNNLLFIINIIKVPVVEETPIIKMQTHGKFSHPRAAGWEILFIYLIIWIYKTALHLYECEQMRWGSSHELLKHILNELSWQLSWWQVHFSIAFVTPLKYSWLVQFMKIYASDTCTSALLRTLSSYENMSFWFLQYSFS